MKLIQNQNDTFAGSTTRCAAAHVTGPVMGTDLSLAGGNAAAMA